MNLALKMAGMRDIPGDSGIWVPGRKVRKALFAIDAGAPEIILAKQMGYDLLIAHHPVGPARLTFSEVVKRHTCFMVEKGVPRKAADKATKGLVEKIDIRAHPANYMHEVDVARALRMPFMNIHLPIDQITREFLITTIKQANAKTVGELVAKLNRIKEFSLAKTKIEVRLGSPKNLMKKWALVFAAGTNGGYAVAKAYFDHEVDTVIYLHIDFEELARLRKDGNGNLVVLGHMAGDSIGINLFLSRLEKMGVQSDKIGVIG